MPDSTNRPIRKLRNTAQPPLSHRGATADSDRARKPALAEPTATGQQLCPGDRVEGLGDFGLLAPTTFWPQKPGRVYSDGDELAF